MDETKSAFDCLECLRAEVDNREKITVLSFQDFLGLAKSEPQRVLRNIFQLFYDMVTGSVIEKEDDYPGDPESIGFVEFDCSKIFSVGRDRPFFPDRLLANRFVRQVRDLKHGVQQNRLYAYDGPPGCGKSTFLDNLLQSFEEYTSTKEGQTFEILWNIKIDDEQKVEVPCPSHDHPILIIPKNHRIYFLDKLLAGQSAEIKHKFFNEKEYEWLFEAEACTICQSLFQFLSDKFNSLDKVLSMIKVRPYRFNRRLGEGISIFNPGDPPMKEMYLSDKQIQEKLDKIFVTDRVRYVFSPLARTNNGIYVLMDIKSCNKERLLELHNVISEGVHKVDGLEERVKSLFFALMNPEDKEVFKEAKSLEQRVRYGKIFYVMEVAAEVKIYLSAFGKNIESYFLPRVLENFVRVIISSRMNQECNSLREWIPEARMKQYNQKRYCDEKGLLLRMEIYGGVIPTWLSDEDKKKFTAPIRRSLIAEAENEGNKGFDGRQSIDLFKEFLNLYGPKLDESNHALINMANVVDYFKHRIGKNVRDTNIPPNFIDSMVDWYDHTVLNEIKESLYFYNREQIQEDILHYLCAINYDADGRKIKCQYTGKEIEVTVEFLRLIGSYITGEALADRSALRKAQEVQKKYIETIARDPGKVITETELYQELFNAYVRNLKENVLKPFIENDDFREAVKSFGSKEFNTFHTRIKDHVTYMMGNLVDKFGYTEQGAKEVCLYVLDKKLS